MPQVLASFFLELESEEEIFGERLLRWHATSGLQQERLSENAPAIEWVSSTHATT